MTNAPTPTTSVVEAAFDQAIATIRDAAGEDIDLQLAIAIAVVMSIICSQEDLGADMQSVREEMADIVLDETIGMITESEQVH